VKRTVGNGYGLTTSQASVPAIRAFAGCSDGFYDPRVAFQIRVLSDWRFIAS
jgi:hypothetical protein